MLKLMVVVFIGTLSPFSSAKMRYESSATDFPPRVQEYAKKHPTNFRLGYLDVTKAPYNAVKDGSKDTALALQSAINDAFRSNLVVYLPKGTYLVNKSLKLFQTKDARGMGQRKFAHVLMGQVGHTPEERPLLKLGADISGPFIHFAYVYKESGPKNESVEVDDKGELSVQGQKVSFTDLTEDASRHYNAHFRNINIDLGNHPSATGLHMNGAQYCVVENVRIFGENFDVGFKNLPGSGGSVTNLEISGGKIGILQDNFRPTPSVHGLRLSGQTLTGLDLKLVRGSVTITGFEISSTSKAVAEYRAIRMNRALSLVNGRITVDHPWAPAIHNNNQDLLIKNVSVKAKVISLNLTSETAVKVPGSVAEHMLVTEYHSARDKNPSLILTGSSSSLIAKGDVSDPVASELSSYQIFHYQQGKRLVNPPLDKSALVIPAITADDDSDDDAPAINAALRSTLPGGGQDRKTVFLPRGHYHIRSPIVVPEGTRLLGAANNISVIAIDAENFNLGGNFISSAIKVEGGVESNLRPAVLADFAILAKAPVRESLELAAPKASRISYLEIGAQTHLRDVQLSQFVGKADAAKYVHLASIIKFSPGSGGKFYNLGFDDFTATAPGVGFAVMKISGNTYPIRLYQPFLEATGADSPNLWLQNANTVSIFGYKFEDSGQIARVEKSKTVELFGAAGNVHFKSEKPPTLPLITLSKDSSGIALYNIFPKPESNGIVSLYDEHKSDKSILVLKRD